MKQNDIDAKTLLAELDMILSEDYGYGVDLDKYPAITNLIEVLKEEV